MDNRVSEIERAIMEDKLERSAVFTQMNQVIQRLEIDAKNLADTNRILCHENLNLSNQIEAMRRECENGKAATELLMWFAKGISEAPPEELPQIVATGYKRIVNLANVLGDQ